MSRNEINKSKIWIFATVLFLSTLLFWGRAFYLQVLEKDKYSKWKDKKYKRIKKILAPRGNIYDRNGNLLAQDVLRYDIKIESKKIINKKLVEKFIKESFPDCKINFKKYFSDNNKSGENDVVYITKDASEEDVVKLNNFRRKYKEWFLSSNPHYKRVYPNGKYAGQVLGFVNYKNDGKSGIEFIANKYLKSISGEEYIISLPKGNAWKDTNLPQKKPIQGSDVYLTIDLDIQVIAEEELEKQVKKSKAKGGMVVAIKPNTSEVIAIASVPRFDPNHPGNYNPECRKNRAVTDIFEPGSTFKIISAATLLESKKVTKDSIVYCENGEYDIYGKKITDHKKYGWLSLENVIANSSNIGISKLIKANVSSKKFYKKILDFGFKRKSNLEIPGEATGLLRNFKKWKDITPLYISFGQGIGVTAIQLANAYCAVVNGGKLIKPHILKRVVNYKNETIIKNEPEIIKEVISKETSDILKNMLRKVVTNGTGDSAGIDGIKVGGKTGTAEIAKKNGGGYYKNKYITSFIGFFPLKEPEFVILVLLDSPSSSYNSGGLIAAPTFKNIVKNITGIPTYYENLSQKDNEIYSPYIDNYYGKNVKTVKSILENYNIDFSIHGKGDFVVSQSIKDRNIKSGEKLKLTLGNINYKFSRLPVLEGKSLKKAIEVLNQLKIKFSVNGNGIVKKQYPSPGSRLDQLKSVKLYCKPG